MTVASQEAGSGELGTLAAAAAYFDVGVTGAVYRVAIGACVFPMQTVLFGSTAGWGTLIATFALVLISIRLVPLFGRRALRFAPEVKEIWAARRQLAKHYDSFQWRKFLWIGAGMGLSLGVVAERPRPFVLLCGVCLAAGVAGMWRWRAVRPHP